MTVDDAYKLCLFCIAKNKQDGYLSPDDFYTVINSAQGMYLDYLLGEYQKQQVGRPIPVVAIGQNQKIRTSLAPLIYGTVLAPNSSTGIAPFPSDFELVDAMWSQYNFYNIRFAQQDSLNSRYRSVIDPVTNTDAIYLIKHEGFQFYPENIGAARLSYVRTPPSIVWAYVLDGNGIPVYDPANSQQPVWGEFDMMQIIARALQMVGVNLQFGTVLQYASEIKNAGQ